MSDIQRSSMKETIEQRLQALRQEFDAGQRMLAELDSKRTDLQQTLLRISGAIQVLEEMVTTEEPQEKVKQLNGSGLAEQPA